MKYPTLDEMRFRRGLMHYCSLLCRLGLFMLSILLTAPRIGNADEFDSKFDDVKFVRIVSGCGMAVDVDQIKSDRRTLKLGPNPSEPFCDAAALSKYLRQQLHAGLLESGNGKERTRDDIVKNDVMGLSAGGAKTLSIRLLVWVSEVTGGNLPMPIHLCTYVLEQQISASNAFDFWARSEPLTGVCEDKSEMASTGMRIVKPMVRDTIAQLRRAR